MRADVMLFVSVILLLVATALWPSEPKVTLEDLGLETQEEIRWQGRLVVEIEGELYALSDVQIGLRDDGVVIWREVE